MTLIISCHTPEYAIQVSDRRLTRLDGTLYDDESNKAVFYLPGVFFSYTGLAELNGVRTDEWLTDILVPGLNLQDLVEDIREKATRRFEAIRSPYKHLAIIGSFWARPITGSGFSGDCLISNYYEVRQPGSRLVPSSVASNQFQAWISLNSTSSPYSLFSAGQPLSEYQIRRLKRFIGRYIRNTTAEERSHGANGLCRHLAEFIRSFANSNSAVGKSLMQTILPNPRAPGVSHSSATFTYLPADSNSHVTFAPNLVNATMRIKGVKLSRFPVSGR